MRCWLATNELDLLDSGGRGFRERLHPLIRREDAVTLTWPACGVAVAAFKLAVARYLKPHEMRVTQLMVSICHDRLHVAPLARTHCAPRAQSIFRRSWHALRLIVGSRTQWR
jgi:hypothetical protein